MSVLESGEGGDVRDGNVKYFWQRLGLSLVQKIVSISEKFI